MAIPKENEMKVRNDSIEEEIGFMTRQNVSDHKVIDSENLLAGLGSVAGKVGRGLMKKMKSKRPVQESINDYANPSIHHEKRGGQRRINVERHHPAAAAGYINELDQVQNAEQLTNLLDMVARDFELGPTTIQKHSDIDEATDGMENILDHLKPVFAGEQNGLLDAVQMNAARKLLTTLGEELVPLANRIADGDQTPAVLAEFQKKRAGFASIQSLVQSNATAIARALSQQNMIAKSVDSGLANVLMESLGDAGGPEAITRMAKLVAKKHEMDGVKGMVSALDLSWRDVGRAFIEYWKANILSSPATHAVNIGGNVLVQLHENWLLKPTAAAIGSGRALFAKAMGRPPLTDRVYWREAYANSRAGYKGLKIGMQAAIDALLERESKLGIPMIGDKLDVEPALEKVLEAGYGHLGKYTAKGITLPFRFLQAEDDFFKAIAYTTELEGLATRQAIDEGLTKAADIDARVATLLKDPPLQMQEQAFDHALSVTFQNKDLGGLMGVMAQSVKNVKQAVPALDLIMPFVTTPTNILNYTLENTALAPISKRIRDDLAAGGAKGDMALARITMGTAVTTLAYFGHDAEIFTGNGPENYQVRRQLMMTGWKPNAVRVGDTWFTINRLDPLGAAIGMVADAMDKAKYAAEDTGAMAMMAESILSLANHGLDASYMRGVKGFLDAVTEGGTTLSKFVANAGSAFMPYSSGRKWVSNIMRGGQQVSLPRNFHKKDIFEQTMILMDAIDDRDRFSNSTYRPARHWDGQVALPQSGVLGFVNAASPVQISRANKKPDPATRELIANNIPVNHPPPIISLGSGPDAIRFSLEDLDNYRGILYDAYIQHVGQARREAIEEVINHYTYKDLVAGKDDERGVALRKASGAGMLLGKERFLKDLQRLVNSHPEINTAVAHAVGDFAGDPSQWIQEGIDRLANEFDVIEKKGKGQTLPLPKHVREQKPLAVTF